jgi:hypothetical protein
MPQVLHERLHLKEPRTERLRRSAAGHLRHLLATGWRETERWHAADYVTVRLEREGKAPERVPSAPPAAQRPRQGNGRQGGGRGRPQSR